MMKWKLLLLKMLIQAYPIMADKGLIPEPFAVVVNHRHEALALAEKISSKPVVITFDSSKAEVENAIAYTNSNCILVFPQLVGGKMPRSIKAQGNMSSLMEAPGKGIITLFAFEKSVPEEYRYGMTQLIITVWFLANTSSWMQQRSTISYTAELFDVIKDREVSTTWLPYIYPADIIGTGLFDEMQNSEEKSLVQSQNCLSYQSIMVKHGDKFDENEIRVLRAVLITNIIKFKFYDRNSCQTALKYCSGLNDEAVEKAIEQLENEFCVISLDESTNRFTLNAEAHGKREFNLAIMKKQSQLRNYDPIQETDEELVRMIGLNQLIETPFGTKNNIVAAEWCYDVRLIRIEQVNDSYLQSTIHNLRASKIVPFIMMM